MKNKLATIKYLPNNFEIIEDGDHVICAISQKKILIKKIWLEMDMKFLIYKAKTSFLKLKIHVLSEKKVRKNLGLPGCSFWSL